MIKEITESPAFPTDSEQQVGPSTWHHSGLTVRQYYVAKLMQGEIAKHGLLNTSRQGVVAAFELADIMIEYGGN